MHKSLTTVQWQESSCSRCPDLVACRLSTSKIVVASPCPRGGLLAIGEAPGAKEDLDGVGFVGDEGEKLRELQTEAGLPTKLFGCANICRCRPPENRKPTRQEIGSCLPYLDSLIREIRPKVILAVGGRTAVTVLCGPGTLTMHIDDRAHAENWSSQLSQSRYEAIHGALSLVPYVVPMPHTSPRVLNNKAWAGIAKKQVAQAVELLMS